MPQAEKEILRTGYEAFNRGDWDAVFEFAPPDFELQTADRVINAGTYHGREEARRFFEDFFEPFEEVAIELDDLIEKGDLILVLALVRSRPIGSSAVVENRVAHLWTTRGGQIVRLQIFPEREKALEAAGLS
jgi:ketosteroid isomerase-like protein